MQAAQTTEGSLYPIQIAARRSGLSPDVMRVWERRYGAVVPHRTETNRRLYSDEDVERLYLLARITRSGRRIGNVARLPLEELRAIHAADLRPSKKRIKLARFESTGESARPHLEACLDAILELNGPKLERALTGAAIDLTVPVLLDQLLQPLMTTLGERWRDGTMRMAHEHLATAVVRSFLGALKNGSSRFENAPEIIVATPSGQRHELGGLMASTVAVADGWRVTYLGADVCAESIVETAKRRNSSAVALGITYPPNEPRLSAELRKLRARLGSDVALFVGGASAAGYAGVLAEIEAILVGDVGEFRTKLAAWRLRRTQ